jgi:hypothetical protein
MGSFSSPHARRLIDGASYGPDVVKALGRAFDEAWQGIAGNFGNDQQIVEAARLRLANALLSAAGEDTTDVEALKTAALLIMSRSYAPKLHPAIVRGPASAADKV